MFEFAWPGLFLLLPLPWLVHSVLPAKRQPAAELPVPFFHEIKHLQHAARPALLGLNRKHLPYLFIWLLLLSAAARPQLPSVVQERPSTGRDLLIALDLSSSMLHSDMTVQGTSISRIEFVQQWLDSFISQRHGDRLGLILFATQAYLQAPLTYDQQSIRTWVQEAQPGIAGNSTAIGDAIGLAIKRLRVRPAEQRVLILITDGANTSGVMSPRAAAQLAARYQIKIYTVGIGSQATVPAQQLIDTAGLELDERSLMEIAALTQGQYFHITDSTDLSHIQSTLDKLEPSATEQAPKRYFTELYHWPLAAALILSMLFVALRSLRAYRQLAIAREIN